MTFIPFDYSRLDNYFLYVFSYFELLNIEHIMRKISPHFYSLFSFHDTVFLLEMISPCVFCIICIQLFPWFWKKLFRCISEFGLRNSISGYFIKLEFNFRVSILYCYLFYDSILLICIFLSLESQPNSSPSPSYSLIFNSTVFDIISKLNGFKSVN